MNTQFKFLWLLLTILSSSPLFSQQIVEVYQTLKTDHIKIGIDSNAVLPYIKAGYTLMLPEHSPIKGTLIFLEDSEYDDKNRSAKQLYQQASEHGFAVLSVSTEIPLDFYFSNTSIASAHNTIKAVFTKHQLPNKNILFLGASLVGHRAMRYIKYIKTQDLDFQLQIKGLVLCNFTMDFTRKWHQHQRDIRIQKINLWEPTFINYMLETHLGGTPETAPEQYHHFSAYSYTDTKLRNIPLYKDYALRVYIEPAIQYRLKTYHRSLYDNNATDMVGFLAEQELAGNTNTELIILQPQDNPAPKKNAQSTWNAIDKTQLMQWILIHTED
jgi:hypothetical protein